MAIARIACYVHNRILFMRGCSWVQRRIVHTDTKYANSSSLGVPIGGVAGLFGSMLGVGGGVIMVVSNMQHLVEGYLLFNRFYAGPSHGLQASVAAGETCFGYVPCSSGRNWTCFRGLYFRHWMCCSLQYRIDFHFLVEITDRVSMAFILQTLYGFYGQVDFVGAAIVASAAMLTAPGLYATFPELP